MPTCCPPILRATLTSHSEVPNVELSLDKNCRCGRLEAEVETSSSS